jgi:hypothetical protein
MSGDGGVDLEQRRHAANSAQPGTVTKGPELLGTVDVDAGLVAVADGG